MQAKQPINAGFSGQDMNDTNEQKIVGARLATGEYIISCVKQTPEADIFDTPMVLQVSNQNGNQTLGLAPFMPFAKQDSITVVPGSVSFWFDPVDAFVDSYKAAYAQVHGRIVTPPEKKIIVS